MLHPGLQSDRLSPSQEVLLMMSCLVTSDYVMNIAYEKIFVGKI